MAITVNLGPDYENKDISFPDDATEAEIQEALDRDYPIKKSSPAPASASPAHETKVIPAPSATEFQPGTGHPDPRVVQKKPLSPVIGAIEEIPGQIVKAVKKNIVEPIQNLNWGKIDPPSGEFPHSDASYQGMPDDDGRMEAQIRKDLGEKASQEKIAADADSLRRRELVNSMRAYKEFWEERGEDPHPTSTVPEVYRPPYDGDLELDGDTLRAMGYNADESGIKSVANLVNPFKPSTWNIEDIAATILDPGEMAAMMATGGISKTMSMTGKGFFKQTFTPKGFGELATGLVTKPAVIKEALDWGAWGIPGALNATRKGITKFSQAVKGGAIASKSEASMAAGRGGRGLSGVLRDVTPESRISADEIAAAAGSKTLARKQQEALAKNVGVFKSLENSVYDDISKVGPGFFEKSIDDVESEMGTSFVHVRRSHDNVQDVLKPHTRPGGVGEEATKKKIYPDIYQERSFGVKSQAYTEAGGDIMKIDKNVANLKAEYIGRSSGPTLDVRSEAYKMIRAKAEGDAVAGGFAPGDQTAIGELSVKIARESGYGAITDAGKTIAIIKDAKVTPLKSQYIEKLVGLHNTQKGLTVDLFDTAWIKNGTIKEIKTGYGVGMYPKKSLTIDTEKLTPKILKDFITSRSPELTLPGNKLGTEAIAGKTNIDISKVIENFDEAVKVGLAAKQERIWSFADNCYITINKGNVATGEASKVVSSEMLGDSVERTRLIKGDIDVLKSSGPSQVKPVAGSFTGEVKGQEPIIKEMVEKLNKAVSYGRLQSRKALGTFSIIPENIRIKFRRDVASTVHEIGHSLQKDFGRGPTIGGKKAYVQGRNILGTTIPEHLSELDRIATKGHKADEGFAEFLSLYVTNDQIARGVAPKFYNYFDTKLALVKPDVRNILLKAREDYWNLMNSSYQNQLDAMITHFPDPTRKIASMGDLYTAVINEIHPLQKAVNDLVGKGTLDFKKDPGVLMELFRGWDGKADAFFRYGTLHPDTFAKTGPGLTERLAPIVKIGKLEQFKRFIIYKRAAELQGVHKTGLSTEQISGGMAEIEKQLSSSEMTAFQEASQLFTDYNNSLLVYAKDFLGEDAVIKLIDKYPDYIPFYHLSPEEWMTSQGIGKGINLFSPIKRMKGTGSSEFGPPILDPIEATLKKTFAVVKAVEENRVRLAMMDMLKTFDRTGTYWSVVPKDRYLAAQATLEEIVSGLPAGIGKDILKGIQNMDPATKDLFRQYANIYRVNKMIPKGEPIIPVYRKGNMELIELKNQGLYEVFSKMSPESSSWFAKIMSTPTRILKTGATLALEFSGANIVRDNFAAYVNSKYGFVPAIDFVKGLAHYAKKDEVYWAWKIGGGDHATFVDVKTGVKAVYEKMVGGKKWSPKQLNPLGMLEQLARLGEIGSRLGEGAKALRAEVGRGNMESTMRMAKAARQVTIDYGQAGARTKLFNQMVAFSNPSLQALNKTVLRFKEDPVTATMKATAAITVPAVGLYLLQKDDPRWKEIDDYWKQSNMIFLAPVKKPNGSWGYLSQAEYDTMTPAQKATYLSDTVYRIPMSQDIGFLFNYLPIKTMEHINKNYDPNFISDIAKGFWSNFGPPFIPNFVYPFAETFTNMSIHTGKKIEPDYMKDLFPEYRSYPYTTETSKWASKGIAEISHAFGSRAGVSPILIDNFIRTAGGGLAATANRMASVGLSTIGLTPRPVGSGPSPTHADVPLLSRFAVRFPSTTMQSSQDFYDMVAIHQMELKTIKDIKKPGNRISNEEALVEYEHGGKPLKNFVAFWKNPYPPNGFSISQIHERIGLLRTYIVAVSEDKDTFTPLQRGHMVNQAYFAMADLAKKGNEIMLQEKYDFRPGIQDTALIPTGE